MAKANGNGSKKAESIKALISIEDNEPYVKLTFQPSAGSLGFEVKQKTREECFKIVDSILNGYQHLMVFKQPKIDKSTSEIESFV